MATGRAEDVLVAFRCHGTAVHVSTDEEVRAHLLDRLPPGSQPCDAARPDVAYRVRRTRPDASGAGHYLLTLRHGTVRERHRLRQAADAAAIAALVADDTEFRVALLAPDRLFIHAAAVAWRGRVLVAPGRTLAGKSTLAAALVRAGASYCSDEFAVLDDDGLVHPFARPLHLRARDGAAARDVRAAELGGRDSVGPLPLALVVATSYRPGAAWAPAPMSDGAVALALLDNAVVARTRPAHALALIARALGHGAAGVRSERGEADATAAALLRLLDASPVAPSAR